MLTIRSGDFFRGGGTGLEQHGHAAGGATNTPVGCLLVRGSQCVGMSTGMTAVLWWTVQDSNRAALRSRVSNQPSGLLLSPRFPTHRNVYQERCRQTFWSGDFFRGGRYRTRTARPRRRRGNKHPSGVFVSARFPTRRNVYQERCRQTHSSQVFLFWWTVQDENRICFPLKVFHCIS